MATATLIAVLGSIVLLYILIKGHIYVIRRLWEPVFEEELEDDPAASEEMEDRDDDEEARVRRGWDEVR